MVGAIAAGCAAGTSAVGGPVQQRPGSAGSVLGSELSMHPERGSWQASAVFGMWAAVQSRVDELILGI